VSPRSDGDDVADGEGEVFCDRGALRHEGTRPSTEFERSGCRRARAREHLEQRRLPRAVGSDDHGEGRVGDVEVDVVERDDPGEFDAETAST